MVNLHSCSPVYCTDMYIFSLNDLISEGFYYMFEQEVQVISKHIRMLPLNVLHASNLEAPYKHTGVNITCETII